MVIFAINGNYQKDMSTYMVIQGKFMGCVPGNWWDDKWCYEWNFMGCFPGSDYLIIHLMKFDNMCYPLFLDSLSGNSGTSTLIDDGPFAKMVIFRRC